MRLTARHGVATPVNRKSGDDVIILPSVSKEEAKRQFAVGWKASKLYLRIVGQPTELQFIGRVKLLNQGLLSCNASNGKIRFETWITEHSPR